MRESKTLEYKENVTNNFLKTVSAYANYGTGKIMFGISDDGTAKGIDNPKRACLDVENRINDSIDPVPEYVLDINERTSVVTLTVSEGLHKPYLYKSKAYRRNDSATVAVDRLELSRLILEGQNSSYEELPAANQQLAFTVLQRKLTDVMHLETFSLDTLKTLELYSDAAGYNKAGELLADKNSFPGIDIARFGDSISIIHDRETLEHVSVLDEFDQTLVFYRKYYQYDEIKGSIRETISLIPEEAFREAVANALVHRTWDVNTHINIAMFPDRIQITSPGGLPKGVSETDFVKGGISILRNRILGSVFFRLHLIEKFGTGIRRINEAYRGSRIKPTFEVTDNSIRITLPVIQKQNDLMANENKVYSLLAGKQLSSSQIVKETGFGKSKVVTILNRLADSGYIRIIGNGRGTKYTAD